jgi:hypothetical protein
MRYRIHEHDAREEHRFTNEDDLIEAISSRGWDLQRRAAEDPDDDAWGDTIA